RWVPLGGRPVGLRRRQGRVLNHPTKHPIAPATAAARPSKDQPPAARQGVGRLALSEAGLLPHRLAAGRKRIWLAGNPLARPCPVWHRIRRFGGFSASASHLSRVALHWGSGDPSLAVGSFRRCWVKTGRAARPLVAGVVSCYSGRKGQRQGGA